MKSRNFAALGANTAAQLNAGTIGVTKDKIVHLDPEAEILYDPAENIRNGKVVDDSLEGLVELRLTIDEAEQLQPIRVYPLPPEKLDPSKPNMKYGIGFGHRRTLSCRLTDADSPLIKGKARKVAATIDVDWLKKGRSYRLRCQIHENTSRVELNPVEFGQALLDYQQELSKEEKRHVSQKELMLVYNLKEKTVYNLLKAAEFHQIAKDVCHRKLLSDLDTMVTFDVICKANEPLAHAIYESLQQEGAPSNRSLIRQAKVMAEDKDYKFDPLTWAWPESVEKSAPTPPLVVHAAGGSGEGQMAPTSSLPGAGAGADQGGGAASGGGQADDKSGEALGSSAAQNQMGASQLEQGSQEPGRKPGSEGGSNAPEGGSGSAPSLPPTTQQPATPPAPAPAPAAQQLGTAPIIMVEFKMAADAPKAFTGELLVGKKAKGASNGVVAYLNEGREEQIEVPLKHISLVSIHHQ